MTSQAAASFSFFALHHHDDRDPSQGQDERCFGQHGQRASFRFHSEAVSDGQRSSQRCHLGKLNGSRPLRGEQHPCRSHVSGSYFHAMADRYDHWDVMWWDERALQGDMRDPTDPPIWAAFVLPIPWEHLRPWRSTQVDPGHCSCRPGSCMLSEMTRCDSGSLKEEIGRLRG